MHAHVRARPTRAQTPCIFTSVRRNILTHATFSVSRPRGACPDAQRIIGSFRGFVIHDHGYKTAGSKIVLITDQFSYLKNPLQKFKNLFFEEIE